MAANFDVFKKYGVWHWSLKHSNGTVLAKSPKGYKEKKNAKRAVESVRTNVVDADIRVPVKV